MKMIELLPPECVPIYLKYCRPFLGPGHGLHVCLRLFVCVCFCFCFFFSKNFDLLFKICLFQS